MASLLAPLVKEVAESVAAPIKHQFNYLCCFTTNITTLKKEAENLQDTTADLQREVDRARDDLRVISNEVETWLQDSKYIKDEIDEILKEVPKTGFLKLRARFSLSKRAKKTTDLLKELQLKRAHDVSWPPPPAAQRAIPLERIYAFESTKRIEEELMRTLRLGDVNMIGILGMGCIGKTTMAKRVANRALEEHVFKEVVFAVVGVTVDKLKVQVDIGRSLGLSDLNDETSEVRVAQKLRARLSGAERILLILDDVWERLEFEDLGIPCNHKGCTILLTSRNRDALRDIDDTNVFLMRVLSQDEAWFMFSEIVGTCVDDRNLYSIAKKVVNECKGLPFALATVGAALRNVMNVGIWKDALRKLEHADPDSLQKRVYNVLKLSYDVLDPIQKTAFLLCCLYPEDADIPLEHLTYYCMGLGIFEGGIEEARNRIQALTYTLKSQSMLSDSKYGNEYVRMHDVFRDVCIFIAKQEGYIGGNDCIWMSSSERSKFPTELVFPNLRLLMWTRNSANEEFEVKWTSDSVNEEFELDSRFLEAVRDLHVLSIENDYLLTSLQLTTLENLKTLVLDSCRGLEALSGVGVLVNLEILICRQCDSIKELPSEIKALNGLKVLDFTGCGGLQRIGREIISSLVGLEELKMHGSFKKWEAEDNATLTEVEALTNLSCLEIEIEDPELAAKNICLSPKLDKFDIRLSASSHEFDSYRSNKKLSLYWKEERYVGDWIDMLLLKAECLFLIGNGANKVELTKWKNIRYFELRECDVKKSGDSSGNNSNWQPEMSFRCVKQLLTDWNPFYGRQIDVSLFNGLEELTIAYYEGRMGFIMSSIAENLFNLKELSIKWCAEMVQVIEDNEETMMSGGERRHLFPNLQILKLENLKKLVSFCKWENDVELDSLSELHISNCAKMKSFTLGLLETPYLKSVHIDTVNFGVVKDLNGILQQPYLIQSKMLSEEDAWSLFKERTGTCVDDRKLNSIAKEVINECKRLPIALTTVGAALRDEMNVDTWKDALQQLRQSHPDTPAMIAYVYNPLKLSYDFLDTKHKSVMLLCCLYPEDADIPLERLTYSCMGLGILEGGIKEARNGMRVLANMLKSRSLLLDSKDGDEYVRMDADVRDVCIFIAKQKGYIGGNDCIWISLTQSFQLPMKFSFPNLRVLLWTRNFANEEFVLDSGFLEGVRDLHVLSIKEDNLISMTLTKRSVKNLKTLVLDSCWKMKALPGVGELVNLEILVCRGCSSIKELPISGLNRLKLLDLTGCYGLQRIGVGVISSLVGLEELKMSGSFKKWEAQDREKRENAALRELEDLTYLRCLEIDIEDAALAAENICLSSKLEKCHIKLSGIRIVHPVEFFRSNRKMHLLLEEDCLVRHLFEMQVDVEYQDLTKLELSNSKSLKKIEISQIGHLRLEELPKQEEIWYGQISLNFFQNLKELRLHHLRALKQVWKGSFRGMDYLPHLEVLNIAYCEMMERVFLWEREDTNEDGSYQSPNSHHMATKILPKLKKLKLIDLSKLTSFYQGIQGIEFPQLTRLQIVGCNKMKIMISKWKESNVSNSGGSSGISNAELEDLHPQPQEMSFGCLKKLSTDWNPFRGHKIDISIFNGLEELIIANHEGNMSFITPSVVEKLINLKVLRIHWCDEMVKVIDDDEEKLMSGSQRILLFPELETLELGYLRKLVYFFECKCDVELPKLKELNIKMCDNMKSFTKGLLYTPKLESVSIISDDDSAVVKDWSKMLLESVWIISDDDLGVAKDWNKMLQQLESNREKRKQLEGKKKGVEDEEREGEREERSVNERKEETVTEIEEEQNP